MGHKIGVDPVDNAGVDIGHLEQRWSLGVPGTAIDPNHISHPPSPIRVGDDHGHSRLDMQNDWIRRGRRNPSPMLKRHNLCFSTAVLAQKRLERPGAKSEGSFNELGAAPNAGARERAMQLSGIPRR